MTSYTTLEVQNFKGIREMKLEGLGMVNVFVGGNNVGKTSVLQTIFSLSNIKSEEEKGKKGIYDDALGSLDFTREFFPFMKDFDIEDFFWQRNTKNKLTLKNNLKQLALYNNAEESNRLVEKRPKDFHLFGRLYNHSPKALENSFILDLNFGDTSKNLVFLEKDQYRYTEDKDAKEKKRRSSNRVSITNNYIPAYADFNFLADYLYEVEQEDLYLEILKPIEPKLLKIRMGKNGIVCFLEKVSTPFSLSLMGDGFVKKLALACLIAKNKGQTLLIDEIENGFHWSVQKDMWRMILTAAKDDGTQFFFTTHSYEVLESLNAVLQEMKDNGDDLTVAPKDAEGNPDTTQEPLDLACVFRLKKDDTDKVTARKYTPNDLDFFTDLGEELR